VERDTEGRGLRRWKQTRKPSHKSGREGEEEQKGRVNSYRYLGRRRHESRGLGGGELVGGNSWEKSVIVLWIRLWAEETRSAPFLK